MNSGKKRKKKLRRQSSAAVRKEAGELPRQSVDDQPGSEADVASEEPCGEICADPTGVELFRQAVADVQPLKPDNRHQQTTKQPPALPLQRKMDEQQVMNELLLPIEDLAELETGEELLFLRPGYSPRLFRRLRRGHFSIGDSIDLHHTNEALAREMILRFLTQSVDRGLGCVRIIHGKGLRSKGLPKLKRLTRGLLRRHPQVIAFASCRPVDGGTGAVQVLLKSARTRPR